MIIGFKSGRKLRDDCFIDALRITQDNLDSKNFYAINPVFDKCRIDPRGCK
jgi:hypothetical protein